MSSESIVLCGIGAVSPLGVGLGEIEQTLLASASGLSRCEPEGGSEPNVRTAGLVKGFVPRNHIDPGRSRRMDPLSMAAVAAAKLAIAEAGLKDTALERTGVAFGTTLGCTATTLRYMGKLVEQGARYTNPIDFPDSIDSAPGSHIALELSLRGPNITQMDGGIVGELSLLQAWTALQRGRAERMLAGAGDRLESFTRQVLERLGLLFQGPEGVAERMAPYDLSACGSLPSEGTAVLVLEREETALARGAPLYARVLGVGRATDPTCGPLAWGDLSRTVAEALREALERARVRADQVSLYSGCGQSIQEVDREELLGVGQVLRHPAKAFALSGATGTVGSLGALRLSVLAWALKNGRVPATLGLETPCETTALEWSRTCTPAKLGIGVHVGFGRGGEVVAVVLGAVRGEQ